MALIVYARTSSATQREDLQLDAWEAAGADQVFVDHAISGTTLDRPGLNEALAYLRDGDVLLIWKMDRLARNVIGVLTTIQELGDRGANAGRLELDALLFQSRDGTPLTTGNGRRQLRRVLGGVVIDGVTPHMFRRTVATAVNDNAGVELAAELLGHTDTRVTVMHYIQRRELVNPGDGGAARPGVQEGRGVIAVQPR